MEPKQISPFALDREAAKFQKRWTTACNSLDRSTAETRAEREVAVDRAYTALIDFLDNNGLEGAPFDPR
jgi:hypothetical protein